MTYSKNDTKLSNQLKTTGTGRRKVAVPSTASNQLKVSDPDELKAPMQHQSRIELPIGAPAPRDYSTKSPSKRSVGKKQL